MQGFVSKLTFLDPHSTLILGVGDGILVYEVELLFLCVGSPDELPLDFGEAISDFGGNLNELHNMGGYAAKKSFSKHISASHVNVVGFPTSQLVVHVVNNELEVPVYWLLMEYRKAKVFTKKGADLDIQNIGAVGGVLSSAIGRENNLGLAGVDALTRLRA